MAGDQTCLWCAASGVLLGTAPEGSGSAAQAPSRRLSCHAPGYALVIRLIPEWYALIPLAQQQRHCMRREREGVVVRVFALDAHRDEVKASSPQSCGLHLHDRLPDLQAAAAVVSRCGLHCMPQVGDGSTQMSARADEWSAKVNAQ